MSRQPATPQPAAAEPAAPQRLRLPATPQKVATKDTELQVMSRMADLYALLQPTARRRVHDYMGARLDTLPVLASVAEVEVPLVLFPDREGEHANEAAAQ